LNSAYKRFADQDTELVFISPDNREDTEKFLKEIDLGEKRNFTMMLDPDFNVIKKLLLFKENDVKGEALPATFIIDKKGTLRFKFIPQHYSERPPLEHVLEMVSVAQSTR